MFNEVDNLFPKQYFSQWYVNVAILNSSSRCQLNRKDEVEGQYEGKV